MHYDELIVDCARAVKENDKHYGDPAETMNRTAALASLILRKPVQAYDVAMILTAVKLARIGTDLTHLDSYKDGMNYLGFAAQLATGGAKPGVPATANGADTSAVRIGHPQRDFDPDNLPGLLRRPAAPGPSGSPGDAPAAGRLG